MSPEPITPTTKKMFDSLSLLIRYHRYRVVGLEHIPQSGRCILVANHSFATYDGFLLGAIIFSKCGRMAMGLGHDHLFDIPLLRDWIKELPLVRATKRNAKQLLAEGRMIGIAPGGLKEALRSHRHRYQVWWRNRKGFVQLAVETQTPVIVGVCPRADDIFTLYPHPLTKWVYKKLRFPFPFFRGLGPSFIPRPVQLTHYLSPPLIPPYWAPGKGLPPKELIESFHKRIIQVAQDLMQS